ncbi:MAG TPA: FKBP-type peptidyl-prolyl cis-trans isomerase, partial [Actinomycetota bacterium]|nr:FKBP-type peptidyl-prolyl cis-trans isomerase [Actinomycetota bacterium]
MRKTLGLRLLSLAALLLPWSLIACDGSGNDAVSCDRDGSTLDDGLRVRDIDCGKGPSAESGFSATVNYIAWIEGPDPTVDTSTFDDTGEGPYTFRLGSGQVVSGWDDGLVGMQVGGVRQLVVPPELAYGEAGFVPHVPPNSTVNYRVE